MQWVLTFIYVCSVTLCMGEEVTLAPVTLPQIAGLQTLLAKSNMTAVSSLLSKATAANTTSLSPANLMPPKISLPSLTVNTNVVNTTSVPFKVPCTCGVFLSGQFVAGSGQEPKGVPPLLQEYDVPMPCTPVGQRQCANKCLEVIARHLRNSATIICGSLDRDCFKERAYLWTKNCNDIWENSHMSAGREYCCKDGLPYKCPLGKM